MPRLSTVLKLIYTLPFFFVYLGVQLEAQTPAFTLANIPTSGVPQLASVADLNRDGKLDIVALNAGSIAVFLGNGDGTFQPELITGIDAYGTLLQVGDLNGDGIPDVVTTDNRTNDILVLLGRGDGTFLSPIIVPPPVGNGNLINSFVLGDFNGDGKLDMVLTANGPYVLFFPGNGDGTFESPSQVQLPVGDSGFPISAADLNGDGKLDLVLALSPNSGEFLSMLGNGDGTFRFLGPYPNAGGAFEPVLAIGDVNGDSIPDVVMGGADTIAVSLGKGDGTFVAGSSYQVHVYVNGLTIGDVNGDGKPDLIASDTQFNVVDSWATILLGNGDGTFAPAVYEPTGDLPTSITAADFNRDGRLDLLTSDQDANTVSVMLNTGMTTCTYSVSTSDTVPAPAIEGDFAATVLTPSNCAWSASIFDPTWQTISGPTSGQGNALVDVFLATNTSPSERTGTITIAGQTLQFSQYGTTCVYSFAGPVFSSALTSGTIGSSGVSTSVTLSASSPSCAWSASSSVPWVTLNASSGTGNATITINVAANSSGSELQGSFTIAGQSFQVIQLDDGQNFTDVLPTDYDFTAVNLFAAQGITTGCGINPPVFCPNDSVTRAQMAVFLVRTILGTSGFYSSPTPYFDDVPPTAFAFAYIQKLYELGISSGCSSAPMLYCPTGTVTRDQMAVFLIRARYGADTPFTWNPTPYFSDVPANAFAFNYIQRMYQDSITTGCTANPPDYCPSNPVTRGEMAIFVVRGGFNELLPPTDPVITSIVPATLSAGTSATFAITGANTSFVQGATQLTFAPNAGITVNSVSVTSPTTMQVSLTASSTAPVEPVSIYEQTEPQEAVLPNSLQIQ